MWDRIDPPLQGWLKVRYIARHTGAIGFLLPKYLCRQQIPLARTKLKSLILHGNNLDSPLMWSVLKSLSQPHSSLIYCYLGSTMELYTY